MTFVPYTWRPASKEVEDALSLSLGRMLPRSHPARQALISYLHLSGIESGYGFFAPNVPPNYKLVFEIHLQNGQVEYQTVSFETSESALRFASLMDYVGRLSYDAGREFIIKSLAQAALRSRTDATSVRAMLGTITYPNPKDFLGGAEPSFQVHYTYEYAQQTHAGGESNGVQDAEGSDSRQPLN